MSTVVSELTEFQRLSRDIKNATRTLQAREARYLVDTYYQMQAYRISTNNQARSMTEDGEPNETINFFVDQMQALENQVKRVLDHWTDSISLGEWSKSITGIGPVIAAGLLAHIDIQKAQTAGQIWRYAGLDPTIEWKSSKECQAFVSEAFSSKSIAYSGDATAIEALALISDHFGRSIPNLLQLVEVEFETDPDTGEVISADKFNPTDLAKKLAKRPWNANLKVICWKLGESFVKVSGNPKDYYGKIYLDRKEYEQHRNDQVTPVSVNTNDHDIVMLNQNANTFAYKIGDNWYTGGNAKWAHETLAKKKIGKDTDAYKAYSIGKLPPAHIHARAKRYAVKMFLSHYHEVGRKLNGLPVPAPFAIEHLPGHIHYLPPPNFP